MPDPAPSHPPNPIFDYVAANQHGPSYQTFGPGYLFSCEYMFYKHDPRPLVLMTRFYADGKVGGLNLHYLTFPYMKHLIENYCGKGTFTWQQVKTDKFIANSYRCYKRNGLRLVKGIDCKFLVVILSQLRSFNPEEVEAMRKEVQKQLKEQLNPKATDMARRYSQVIPGQEDNYGLDRETRSPDQVPNIATIPTTPGEPATIPGKPI